MEKDNLLRDMVKTNDKTIANLLNDLADGTTEICEEDGNIDLLEFHDVMLRHWLTINTTIQERFYNLLTAMEDQIYSIDTATHIKLDILSTKLKEIIDDL